MDVPYNLQVCMHNTFRHLILIIIDFRMYDAGKFPVWIVSDLRRKEELEYFRSQPFN